MSKYEKFIMLKDGERCCKICHKKLKEQRDGCTTGLRYHFTKVHDVLNEEKSRKRVSELSENDTPKRLQPTIAESFNDWNVESLKSSEAHRAIAQYICTSGSSFATIEEVGFKNMMKKVNPKLRLKSRFEITRVQIPSLYEEYENKLKRELKEADYVSISFDSWSEHYNKYQITGIIAHFIKDDSLIYRVLDLTDAGKEKHTGDNISRSLSESLETYDLSEKVVAVLRDGASNVKSAGNKLEYTHFDCLSHKLNLAVQDAIEVFGIDVDCVVEKLKKICRKINKSSNLDRDWKDVQESLNISPINLIKNVEVRWSTYFDMVERAIRVKSSLNLLLANHPELPQICSDDWKIVESVHQFLKPISSTLKATQNRGLTASSIIPTVEVLIQQFTQMQQFPIPREALIGRLKSELKKYRDVDYLNVACALDPRFKLKFHDDSIKERLITIVTEYMKQNVDDAGIGPSENNISDVSPINSSSEDLDPLICFYQAKSASEAVIPVSSNDKAMLVGEIEKWTTSEVLLNSSPIIFWSSDLTKSSYPLLSKVAPKYFCTPSGTVECERTFSTARHLLRDNRKSMSSLNFRMSLKLNKNIPLIGFEK